MQEFSAAAKGGTLAPARHPAPPTAADSAIDALLPLLADAPDLSLLSNRDSWSEIRENAGHYGVAPLIAYAVRQHVSAPGRAWCDGILTSSWMRHERMLGHLSCLLGLLQDAGVPAIALKGPLLARRYYTPVFLRKPSMDLDIAVSETNLERACAALARGGYMLDAPLRDVLTNTHHAELSHPTRPHVELHFRLTHRALGIPVDEFFDRAISVPLPNGQKALVLGPADQILHLVLHLAQSRFGTLFHIAEIRRVCHQEPPEVRAEAIRRAVSHRYSGALRMLDIAFRVYWNEPFLQPNIEVPKTWLNWRLTPDLYRAFERFSVPGRPMNLPARLYGRWLDVQLTDTLADALRTAGFFLRTARFYARDKRAWGTPRHIHFTDTRTPPAADPAKIDGSSL